ncbi:MAG: hypothetical protein ACE5OQ_09555 [Woeseia sp.]
MDRTIRTLSAVYPALGALIMAVAPYAASAQDSEKIPFADAEIFFELNNTDGDLGIHALIDGDGWKRLAIEDPDERKMLNVRVKGRLRRQGLTEIFFESAEPTFDELPPGVFFARFPEGEYEIAGTTLDGMELASEAELTHTIPAPANTRVNGLPTSDQCVDEDLITEIPDTGAITISWDPVMTSHPDVMGGGAGVQPPIPVEIHNYEVVVEVEAENPDPAGEPFDAVFSVELPPWETETTLPDEFFELGDEFKYEVLAREESFNQTAVESCIVLGD